MNLVLAEAKRNISAVVESKEMILKGKKTQLRPSTVEDIPLFFKFAAKSDATPFWYDIYGDEKPTFNEFINDWKKYYFNGSAPEMGRSFIILFHGRPIGQINYNKINRKDNSVGIDILIASGYDQGRGLGSDALKTLVKYLFSKLAIKICYIDTVFENSRAVHVFTKSGFKAQKKFKKKGKIWQRLVMSNPKKED